MWDAKIYNFNCIIEMDTKLKFNNVSFPLQKLENGQKIQLKEGRGEKVYR